MKSLFAVMVLCALNSVAFAGWDYPAKQFNLGAAKLSVGDLPANGRDIVALVPLVDSQYHFSTPSQAADWSLGFCYAAGIFNVKPATGSNVSVNAQLFIGVGVTAQFSNFFENNGQGSIPLDYGIILGIPSAQGIPQLTVGLEWESGNPHEKVTVGAAVPLEILDGGLVHTLFNL